MRAAAALCVCVAYTMLLLLLLLNGAAGASWSPAGGTCAIKWSDSAVFNFSSLTRARNNPYIVPGPDANNKNLYYVFNLCDALQRPGVTETAPLPAWQFSYNSWLSLSGVSATDPAPWSVQFAGASWESGIIFKYSHGESTNCASGVTQRDLAITITCAAVLSVNLTSVFVSEQGSCHYTTAIRHQSACHPACPVGKNGLVCSGRGTCAGGASPACTCDQGRSGAACETGAQWSKLSTPCSLSWQPTGGSSTASPALFNLSSLTRPPTQPYTAADASAQHSTAYFYLFNVCEAALRPEFGENDTTPLPAWQYWGSRWVALSGIADNDRTPWTMNFAGSSWESGIIVKYSHGDPDCGSVGTRDFSITVTCAPGVFDISSQLASPGATESPACHYGISLRHQSACHPACPVAANGLMCNGHGTCAGGATPVCTCEWGLTGPTCEQKAWSPAGGTCAITWPSSTPRGSGALFNLTSLSRAPSDPFITPADSTASTRYVFNVCNYALRPGVAENAPLPAWQYYVSRWVALAGTGVTNDSSVPPWTMSFAGASWESGIVVKYINGDTDCGTGTRDFSITVTCAAVLDVSSQLVSLAVTESPACHYGVTLRHQSACHPACPVGVNSLVCSGRGTCSGGATPACTCDFGFNGTACDNGDPLQVQVEWPSFLSRSDPVWSWTHNARSPADWFQSAFLGNGRVGALLRTDGGSRADRIVIDVGRTDLYDTRAPGSKYAQNNALTDRFRLSPGVLYLGADANKAASTPISAQMRLDLYQAEVRGTVTNSLGTLSFTAFFADSLDVIVFNMTATNSAMFSSVWFSPYDAISANAQGNSRYTRNPAPVARDAPPIKISEQALLGGGSFAVGHWVQQIDSSSALLFIAVSPVMNNDAVGWVSAQIKQASNTGLSKLIDAHRSWWRLFWPRSLISWRDTRMESFYLLQLYKMGSATRQDGTLIDLQGPWAKYLTSWPDLHWDLNVQLWYWPVYTSNHLDLGLSLTSYLDSHLNNFISNVPSQYRSDCAAVPTTGSGLDGLETCYWEWADGCLVQPPAIVGNLLFVLHNYWMQYRYSMDRDLLSRMYPLLRRAVQYHVRLTQYNSGDGLYHMQKTFSPEYMNGRGSDTNYDLALLRFGYKIATEAISRLGISEPLLDGWKKVMDKLAPYPTNGDGYMIASGVPFSATHRHFSHLFMIFPLALVQPDTDSNTFNLAARSIDHWLSLKGGETGFTAVGAAVMSALLNRPDAFYNNMTWLLNSFLTPNTMYWEADHSPCGETPPAGAYGLQEALLRSDNGVIRVFPTAGGFGDVWIHQLRAEGAFLVSAAYVNRATQFIRVYSEAGEPCIVQTDMPAPYAVTPASVSFSVLKTGRVQLALSAGQWAVLYSPSTVPRDAAGQPQFVIRTAAGTGSQFNYWGVH